MNHPADRIAEVDLSRRDIVVRLGAGGLAALLLVETRAQPGLAAQDATPPGPVGVSMQMMGAGQPDTARGMELTLRRTTLAPGGGYRPTAIRARW